MSAKREDRRDTRVSLENILLLPRNRRLYTSRETALGAAVVQAPLLVIALSDV
jgi:hypothetical protein